MNTKKTVAKTVPKIVRRSKRTTGSGPPKRDPYKLLMRNLNVDNENKICLKKICAKRLYIKNFADERDDLRGFNEKLISDTKTTKFSKHFSMLKFPPSPILMHMRA